MLAGVAYEVPHDQEISGKLHLLYNRDFPIEALLIFGDAVLQRASGFGAANGLEAACKSFTCDVLKIAISGESCGHIEMRKWVADLLNPHVAALSDGQCTGKHLRGVFKHARHLLVILNVEVRALELHP